MCCTQLAGNTGCKKSPFWHHLTTLSDYIFRTKASTIGKKNLLNSNTSSTCPDNMVNFGLLAAEICWQVWGIPANFNGFRFLAALLHGTLLVGISQTLQRWTECATYIPQGGHHVGHWPTFLVLYVSFVIAQEYVTEVRNVLPLPCTILSTAMLDVWECAYCLLMCWAFYVESTTRQHMLHERPCSV